MNEIKRKVYEIGESQSLRFNGAMQDRMDTHINNTKGLSGLNILAENNGSLINERLINSIDRTHILSQTAIKNADGITKGMVKSLYNLELPDGPYRTYFTKAGDYSLLAGQKGHLSIIRMRDMNMEMEIHLDDEVSSATFLNDKNLFAVARPNEITILDNKGLEIHNLTSYKGTQFLEYLPHHWLLSHTGNTNALFYHDITTGKNEGKVLFKRPNLPMAMCQNPTTAVICVGHSDGCVSLCAPSVQNPLATMRCHPYGGGVLAIACDPKRGDRMATAGMDGMLRIWDIRNYSKCLCEYNYQTMFGQGVRAIDLDVSQTGLVALGLSTGVHIFNFDEDPDYKDNIKGLAGYTPKVIDNSKPENREIKTIHDKITGEEITQYSYKSRTKPYISHMFRNKNSRLKQLCFRPYQDSLSIGLTSGVQSILVPGSGSAEFDTFKDNIYETSKQRSENVVRNMLEKIPAYMIAGASQLTEIKKLTEDEKVRLGLGRITAAMSNRLSKKVLESKSKRGPKGKMIAKQNARNSEIKINREEAERKVKTHIGHRNDGSRIDNRFMNTTSNKKNTTTLGKKNKFVKLLN